MARPNVDIVLDSLRVNGVQTLDELAAALLRAGKTASNKVAAEAIRNSRRATGKGATIVALGKTRYALIDRYPDGVRQVDGKWQYRGETRWRDTSCQTAEEALALRNKMPAGGCLI